MENQTPNKLNHPPLLLHTIMIVFLLMGIGLAFVPRELFYEEASILAVIMLGAPAFFGILRWLGKWRGFLVIAGLGIFALAIETLGLHTGFPYSEFTYVLPFGDLLFGTTPWTVAIAWSPLVIGAFALGYYRGARKLIDLISFTVVVLVFTDFVLDPGAVARGLWSYTESGWYGVPLQNFVGWIFSGTLASTILYGITRSVQKPSWRNLQWLITSLVCSLALWTGVNIGYANYVPAAIGFGVMAITLLSFQHRNTRLISIQPKKR